MRLPLQSAIYLYNVHDAGKTTSETPFFCYSHLIMKFNVSPADSGVAIRKPNPAGPAELEQNAALPPALLQVPTWSCEQAPLVLSLLLTHALQQSVRLAGFVNTFHLILQDLTKRAMAGESDRSLKFGKSAGMWLFNDRGWDHEDNLGAPSPPC